MNSFTTAQSGGSNPALPRMARVRQNFPRSAPLNLESIIKAEFEKIRPRIRGGSSIAVGVGSRGISNLPLIVRAVLDLLKQAGAQPFILPAMGSHGGATPEGQRAVLEGYGITEEKMGVPIRPSLEVRQVGETPGGVPVFCSVEALSADGILLINRIKPHTDFKGSLGSGIVKMCVVGLGKKDGAAAMHQAASHGGHEKTIREIARVLMNEAPVVGGVAILENQYHETASIHVLPHPSIEALENELFQTARFLMPAIPFDQLDLVIIDQIGKNLSGAGMDPNVTNRWVQGYSSDLTPPDDSTPFIRRVFVRDMTPETHGNAIGIGLADVTTSRLVRGMNLPATYINALTALTLQTAKIPIHFETDRECVERALVSVALPDIRNARVVRILDTLSLHEMEISEALLSELEINPQLEMAAPAVEMKFDSEGNLPPLFA